MISSIKKFLNIISTNSLLLANVVSSFFSSPRFALPPTELDDVNKKDVFVCFHHSTFPRLPLSSTWIANCSATATKSPNSTAHWAFQRSFHRIRFEHSTFRVYFVAELLRESVVTGSEAEAVAESVEVD